jgi:hypothetical protein
MAMRSQANQNMMPQGNNQFPQAGGFPSYRPGQAQSQQSPYTNSQSYGQQGGSPAPQQQSGGFSAYSPQSGGSGSYSQQSGGFGSYSPQSGGFGAYQQQMPSFQFQATDWMGNTYDNPAAFNNQQGAWAAALNNQRQQQIQGNAPMGSLNPFAAYQQGQQMIQGGWTNPFAQQTPSQPAMDPSRLGGQTFAPQYAGSPGPGDGAPFGGSQEPWKDDEYFRRWQMNQIRGGPAGPMPDIRDEYERYLSLPKRDGRILKPDPRREMEDLKQKTFADYPHWQGRPDMPSGSVWDHPQNAAVRDRIMQNIAEYDRDPYADTDWAPLPPSQPPNQLPGYNNRPRVVASGQAQPIQDPYASANRPIPPVTVRNGVPHGGVEQVLLDSQFFDGNGDGKDDQFGWTQSEWDRGRETVSRQRQAAARELQIKDMGQAAKNAAFNAGQQAKQDRGTKAQQAAIKRQDNELRKRLPFTRPTK